VQRVSMREPLTVVLALFIIQFACNTPQTEIWRGRSAAASWYRYAGRWIVAVDDIDPENNDATDRSKTSPSPPSALLGE